MAEANAKLALGRKANLGLTTPSERLVNTGNLPFIPYGAPSLLLKMHADAAADISSQTRSQRLARVSGRVLVEWVI